MTTIPLLNYLTIFGAEQFGLYTYQNYLEVAFLSYVIYRGFIWLSKDYTKHLLLYIYGYSFITICSYILDASVLFSICIMSAPVIFMFCVIIHQRSLQKHFALRSVHHVSMQKVPHTQWFELTIRAILLATHHKKNITCIIEFDDTLQSLLNAPFFLDIPIHKDVVDFIVSSQNITNPTIIWLNKHGFIHTINATCSELLLHELTTDNNHDSQKKLHSICQKITQKTDALAFHIQPSTLRATFWYQGTKVQDITLEQLISLCLPLIKQNHSNHQSLPKGNLYAQKNHTTSSQSPHH